MTVFTSSDGEREGLFRPQALIHQREKTHSRAVITQSGAIQLCVWFSVLMLVVALVVLFLIRYKETEAARGILETVSPIQKMKAPALAIVNGIAVNEGDVVQRGQVVMTLSTVVLNGAGESDQDNDIRQLELDEQLLVQQLAIESSRYDTEIFRLSVQNQATEDLVTALTRELEMLSQRVDLSKTNLVSFERLLAQSNVSQARYDIELSNHLDIERE